MNRWVIPYIDQPPDFWSRLEDDFGDCIEEVYFPMPQGRLASGRSQQPEVHLEEFLKSSALPKAVLANPVVLPQPVAAAAPPILRLLEDLYQRYRVSSVTVTSLELARVIRAALPGLHITASCLMGVATPAQVPLLQGNVDSLTPDTRLSHDLPGLRRLRSAFDGKLRLLVNESCLPGCLMRTQHFYEMAYSPVFPLSLCQLVLEQAPWLRMTGGWILPQHLHFYAGVCDRFKLAGRVTLKDPQRYLRVLSAYIHRTPLQPADIGGGPASILDPVDIPDDFFETILNCDKNCQRCMVCRDFYAAHVCA
ncbi:MAG: hypothetical protein GYA17_04390 [Chloroflexi bacterium]|nr:hypothetical protein [Chloroflexota bacterium]